MPGRGRTPDDFRDVGRQRSPPSAVVGLAPPYRTVGYNAVTVKAADDTPSSPRTIRWRAAGRRFVFSSSRTESAPQAGRRPPEPPNADRTDASHREPRRLGRIRLSRAHDARPTRRRLVLPPRRGGCRRADRAGGPRLPRPRRNRRSWIARRRGGPRPCGLGLGWLAAAVEGGRFAGVTAAQATPGWATPYAILVWQALGEHERCLATRAPRGCSTSRPDDVAGRRPQEDRRPRHDARRLALGRRHAFLARADRDGRAGPRRELGMGTTRGSTRGSALIRDRAVDRRRLELRQQGASSDAASPPAAPTGLALLTLAGRGRRDAMIDRADRLPRRQTLPGVRASARWGGAFSASALGRCPAGTRRLARRDRSER